MSHETRQTRADRLRERAERIRKESDAAYARSQNLTAGIPAGQPILVGHHSEARHRNALDKSWNALGKAVTLDKEAAELDRRAEAAESNDAIYGDDPDAIAKLTQKLADLEAKQTLMVATNKLVKKNDREGLAKLGYSEARINQLFTPNCFGRTGYDSFELTNNGATIRATKKRLEEMAAKQAKTSTETVIFGVRVIECIEDDRLRLVFDGKPAQEIIDLLKQNGFKWSPTNSAWQRQLTGNAIYGAKNVLRKVKEFAGL